MVLEVFDTKLRERWSGYPFSGTPFARLVGHPPVIHACTEYSSPYRPLMELLLKLMAHLPDAAPTDAKDVLIDTLQRLVPAA